jgi:hypothetical protein
MQLPNFLIIGVPKAGTTSLWHYLRQHPNIYLPELKEPRFYIDIPDSWLRDKQISTLAAYRSLFDSIESESAIGEASPGYFSEVKDPGCIRDVLGEPKLILILRNPIRRAYSHFLFSKQKGLEPEEATFRSTIVNQKIKKGKKIRERPYVRIGFYYKHLKKWESVFSSKKIDIFFFSDLVKDEISLVRNVYKSLGVNPKFKPNTNIGKRAKSGIPKSKLIHEAISNTSKIKNKLKEWVPGNFIKYTKSILNPAKIYLKNQNLKKPSIRKDDYILLAEKYEDDIVKLSKKLGRDLTHWLRYET